MPHFNDYEALTLRHHQLRRKLHTAYINHLPEEIITTLKKQKYSVKMEINNMQNPFTFNKKDFSGSEKVA